MEDDNLIGYCRNFDNDDKGKSIPKTIPPSSPPAPRKEEKKELNIDEEERSIARRMGIPPEEFVRLRDASSDVNTWKQEENK